MSSRIFSRISGVSIRFFGFLLALVSRAGVFLVASFLAGAFLVLSVHAYYIRKGRYVELSKRAFKIALIVATVVSFTQLLSGHSSADGVAVNQPAKLAAMEGHYEPSAPADLYLLGWVDNDNQTVTGLGVPGGLSFLVFEK